MYVCKQISKDWQELVASLHAGSYRMFGLAGQQLAGKCKNQQQVEHVCNMWQNTAVLRSIGIVLQAVWVALTLA
jgi:hypothetical protein